MAIFSIGSDPEVLLVKNQSLEVVSAVDIIPGDKHHPFKTSNGAIQYDNIFAEFNSVPARSLQDFIGNHHKILGDLRDFIKDQGLDVDLSRSAVMADESLLMDIRTMMAGCEPDFNAWTGMVNEAPQFHSSLRAAGGHLHIAFDECEQDPMGSPETRFKLVRALDLVLGVPSILMEPEGALRKQLYGKAGACRLKCKRGALSHNGALDPYDGVEYRVLSNFWLKSDKLMSWAYTGVQHAIENLSFLSEVAERHGDMILSAINNNDHDTAGRLVDQFDLAVA